jgi:hypothetical protein
VDADFVTCLALLRAGDTTECRRRLTGILAERPDDPNARFLLTLVAATADSRDHGAGQSALPVRTTGVGGEHKSALAAREAMLAVKDKENAGLSRRLRLAEANLQAIHGSTIWRGTRWLVRQVDRAKRLRRPSGREVLRKARRFAFPIGSRRERIYLALIRLLSRPLLNVIAATRFLSVLAPAIGASSPGESPELSLRSPDIDLGPLKFIPRDGRLFSNLNQLVGEMYLGRVVYPIFPGLDNAWFEFFEPIAWYPDDRTHIDTARIAALPATRGDLATPEFRLPAARRSLYQRDDFRDWRCAVHAAVTHRLRVGPDIRANINAQLARMTGRRIGVHVGPPWRLTKHGGAFFEHYFAAIDWIRADHPDSSLFLATDNELAIATFRHRYGDSVLYYPNRAYPVDADTHHILCGESPHYGFVDQPVVAVCANRIGTIQTSSVSRSMTCWRGLMGHPVPLPMNRRRPKPARIRLARVKRRCPTSLPSRHATI